MIKHEWLRFGVLPKPGTLVAIDVESVSMQRVGSFQLDPFMYAYFYSTGGRTVSISQLASALHSFLSYEGSAPEEGIPFIHHRLSHRVLGHSRLPLSASLRKALGSAPVKAHLTSLQLVYKEVRLIGVFDEKLGGLYRARKQHVRDCAHLSTCEATTTTAATLPNRPRSCRHPP